MRVVQKSKLAIANASQEPETVDINCLTATNGAHLHDGVHYEYEEQDELHNLTDSVDDAAETNMRLNLMQLLPSNSNAGSEKADTLVGSGGNLGADCRSAQVNEYFGKMVVAQLNQMDERQAHQTRERIQALIGQVLYAADPAQHFNDNQFNS